MDDEPLRDRGDLLTALASEDLAPLSVAELDDRIARLQEEIARTARHREAASRHRRAADALFRSTPG
ncbi:DUF1192 domain-containing protein [Erythrobacteraceae bacterium CFH 75059]|uniref:DUF1192 domain-containing protein n=1 Tax=Qipengyuania thermophila TaxID=2509361 RepID=UPI0010213D9F|nr:DUF1192 domain-containing protein [Qipengyuania thermophila]TCD06713.1 DUF1192 domain-containing protein [Erythrobacteraceae bacterium CFH 75059]